MALTQQITCDVCTKKKGEANHWFMFDLRTRDITFEPWEPVEYEYKSHACSEACCMTILSRTLSKWGERGDGRSTREYEVDREPQRAVDSRL